MTPGEHEHGPASGGCGPGQDASPSHLQPDEPGRSAAPRRSHTHADAHGATATGSRRHALTIVLAISTGIAVAEVVGAIVTGSLVLLADAAHMAADAAGIGLSLLAAWFASRPPTARRTFGYARAEILAAVINSLLLLGMAAFIFTEAIRRLMSPPAVSSGLLIGFGVVALLANGCSLLVLRTGQSESLNVRGAFLEVAADTLGATAVIVTGVIIATTGFYLADPIASLVVGVLILPRTWQLLREAVDVLLEASPEGIDLAEIRAHMACVPGIREVHELHVWTITSGQPVFSAHVVVDPEVIERGQSAIMLDRLQQCLSGHFDVDHSTFQLEPAGHADHEHPMHG
ncbi:MAG TPA: cation diffusion facilitator family transporter [Streptosporangiaceae bacterium]|nr:cation diffusion facilitator family transporter [Streptosporangiaceae bacterium]